MTLLPKKKNIYIYIYFFFLKEEYVRFGRNKWSLILDARLIESRAFCSGTDIDHYP